MKPPRDAALHAGEPIPAPQGQPSPAGRVGQLELTVDVHRMVDRGDQGQPESGQPQHSVAEALVVVDDVVRPGFVLAGAEPAGRTSSAHRIRPSSLWPLQGIHPVAVLAGARHPERVGLPVEVEARHPCQGDVVVERRIGLPGENLHGVSLPDQFPAQVPHVHALPTAEGIPPVGEQRDPNGSSVK